ncbi:MAG: IS110 family transposase [Anaerolineales bacterium]|jgi:transposase
MAAARSHEYSVFESVLYLAFELSNTKWKLGFTTGPSRRPRERSITAGDLEALQEEIGRAKKRFDLPESSRVVSCYEAGRDAFWLHRYLEQQGIENLVVDSSSIQVNRRARQAKTDRMDVEKLLGQLIQYRGGDRAVWSVVRVPSVEAEDNRQLHRELRTLKKDRTRHTNRIKSFLVGQGIRMKVGNDFLEEIEQVRKWDGSALPASLKARLQREYQRLQLLQEQVKELERERVEAIRHGEDESVEVVRKLMRLNGIGQNAGWLFGMEFFSWRKFNNRKEVGALAGLVPMPRQSGDSYREQGISKAGNRHVRGMAIEIAWGWLQFQPESELTKWYEERFGHGSKRIRKIGIVALARKLLIELWRYLETGAIPEGAVLKTRLI